MHNVSFYRFFFLSPIFFFVFCFLSCYKSGGPVVSGRYEGTGEGLIGPIKVSVQIERSKIKAIDVLEYSDTPGYSDTVFEFLPNKIIKEGAVDIDAVSGATITSRGFVQAVSDALKKAGLTPETLRKR